MEPGIPPDPLRLAREAAGDDTAFLKDLLRTFLADTTARMEAIREAIGKADTRTAARLLHSLKGAAASIGAAEVAAGVKEVEAALLAGDACMTRESLAELRRQFDGLTDIIREELDS